MKSLFRKIWHAHCRSSILQRLRQILVQWHDKEENIVNLWLSLHLVLENQARTLRSQWTVLGCILIVLNENLAV